jgi:protein-tyrosine phosphatase
MKASLLFVIAVLFQMASIAQIADSSKRLVKLTGAVNFRDIGGYPTSHGKFVSWGKIYRSAEINNLNATDLDKLNGLLIHTVLDFRGPAEYSIAPDKLPMGAARISLQAGSEQVGDRTKMMQQMTKAQNGDSIMLPFYTDLTPFKNRYQPMFAVLLNNHKDSAVLYHCTAGKDRTGIATALILYALGVDEKTIMADYLASNFYRASDMNRMKKLLIESYHMNESVVEDVMGVKEKYLQGTFDAINSKYGSIDKFLKTEMGLTNHKRKILYCKYLINTIE